MAWSIVRPSHFAQNFAEAVALLGGIRSGADPYVSDGVPRVLGRPATSVSPRLLLRVRR